MIGAQRPQLWHWLWLCACVLSACVHLGACNKNFGLKKEFSIQFDTTRESTQQVVGFPKIYWNSEFPKFQKQAGFSFSSAADIV